MLQRSRPGITHAYLGHGVTKRQLPRDGRTDGTGTDDRKNHEWGTWLVLPDGFVGSGRLEGARLVDVLARQNTNEDRSNEDDNHQQHRVGSGGAEFVQA